jgi:hypothetical protein
MKCYTHRDIEAVAVCRSCGRALCRECVTEVGLSCSCKGRCESVVAAMNELVERGRTAYQKTSVLQHRNGVFIILLGVAFLALGVIDLSRGEASEWTYFVFAAGVLFAGMGVSSLIAARRFREK